MQNFETSRLYVNPRSYLLGHAEVSKFKNGIFIITQEYVEGQFIPLTRVINQLIANTDFLPIASNYVVSLVHY